MRAQPLVLAKAPRPGLVKTRLAATVGDDAAAELAALCLLDTIAACSAASARCHLALAGDLAGVVLEDELRRSLIGWRVFAQQGDGLAERIAHAHATIAGPVVQVGMDTPQVTADDLAAADAALEDSPAVLGHADDGGWWLLGLQDPSRAGVLTDVPMSQADTGTRTARALLGAGLHIEVVRRLRDVDTAEDAEIVARLAPGTRFGRRWHELPVRSPVR
ncbi:TIGR04282 family arsenosugar biosynthesis glycosyltransferase [Nocardioides sp. Root140]|uniref:TIGR04282 family arsenosugar biosynthesis glycosyltransferase n=1 Tax=Nocardioides sp. Root140 TaxID=1736460 RepID=UPI0006F54F76|nr:DUF2064 domain-containing protein [Nocardioides sp. Root140]KQY62506.1 hypothetical protein ASD30_24420 [Nocardioides sp. Root140]